MSNWKILRRIYNEHEVLAIVVFSVVGMVALLVIGLATATSPLSDAILTAIATVAAIVTTISLARALSKTSPRQH